MINVTASSSKISATASTTGVGAVVHSTSVSSTASGGIGPAGPATATLGEILDVELSATAPGDVLQYSESKWRNSSSSTSPVDGGNW